MGGLRIPRKWPGIRLQSRDKGLTIATGMALTLVLVIFSFFLPDLSESLRNKVSDLQIGALPRAKASEVPVILMVDEKSLKAYGQWPWPRYRLARLLDKLAQSGASAVGIDALFPEHDRSSLAEVRRELKTAFDYDLPLDGVPASVQDYDEIFAKSLTSGPFVLSYYFSFDKDPMEDCQPKSVHPGFWVDRSNAEDSWDKRLKEIHRAAGVLCSVPILSEAAPALGFINTAPDDDGIYRRTPLVVEWNKKLYPSLGLETLLIAIGIRQVTIKSQDEGFILQFGDRRVPLDADGNFRIRFRGPSHRYKYLSAVDVLEGRAGREQLENKIVFIGISAAGLLEIRPTQYDSLYPGVEFHAAIVDNLVTGDFLTRLANAEVYEALLAFVFGVALTVLLACAGPLISALAPVLLILGAIALSQILLAQTGMLLSPALSVVVLISVQLMLSLLKYAREKLHSEENLRQVMASQEATIEGFCAMSEYRDPETGAHIKRTQNYVKALAECLRTHPRFKHCLNDHTIEMMYKTAPLHDVGKIGVPDYILLKPGALSEEEFEIMKKHTEYGAQVFELIQKRVGENDFLRIAIEIILGHQEKWDGSGYPRGLSGDNIPVSARLMALADVYDALISRRVYKPPFPHYQAVKMIVEGKGKHFDPDIVEAFLEIEEQFKQCALRFLDDDEQREALLREQTDHG